MSLRFNGAYITATYNPLISGALIAETLIVAGGGAGGNYVNVGISGGGGAGGVLYGSAVPFTPGVTYTVTVGSGGAGGSSAYPSTQGGDSSITATGVSWIAKGGATAPSWGPSIYDGGSGAGSSYDLRGQSTGTLSNSYSFGNQPQYLSAGYFTAYGNNGGPSSTNQSSNSILGGGGGGAGAVGGTPNFTANTCGNGGAGIQLSITGTATYYAGGGGSNGYNTSGNGTGGAGGGGSGVYTSGPPNGGHNATANTGGGGGGGDYVSNNNGAGGSGIIIISVPIAYTAVSTTGSPTVTTTASRRIYSFTGSGTITF